MISGIIGREMSAGTTHAMGALALIISAAPAIAQTITSTASYPYCEASALPPGVTRPAQPINSNALCWMHLSGYGGNGQLYQHWQLVSPQAWDASNYHGFHTPSQ